MWSLRPHSKGWIVSRLLTLRSRWPCPHRLAFGPWALLSYCSPRKKQIFFLFFFFQYTLSKIKRTIIHQWFSYSTKLRVCHMRGCAGIWNCKALEDCLGPRTKPWSWLVCDWLLRLVLGANRLQAAPVLCLGKSHWEQAGNQLTFKQFGYSQTQC